ncbi:cyclic lactone autoinducer peptide [Desulfolucanica intricata]|nr:cyclic lactone autoinducer peptide [Desulfolucanica intricata]
MKRYVFSMIVCLASVIAFIGVHPTSLCTLYQPEVPEELIR